MEVVLSVKRLVHFLTKRKEIFSPPNARSEVGIVGIELKPDTTGQAVEHRIHHVVDFDEQAAVNADMIYKNPSERLIYLPIIIYLHKINYVTTTYFTIIFFVVPSLWRRM
jgi:hypothetical protein